MRNADELVMEPRISIFLLDRTQRSSPVADKTGTPPLGSHASG